MRNLASSNMEVEETLKAMKDHIRTWVHNQRRFSIAIWREFFHLLHIDFKEAFEMEEKKKKQMKKHMWNIAIVGWGDGRDACQD